METIEELRLRTEDLRKDEILELFVSTPADEEIIRVLKSATPVLLEASRGTGKSFLLRVAEMQLENDFDQKRVLPVYVSFIRSSLVQTSDTLKFQHWMLSKICNRLLRSLKSHGFVDAFNTNVLAGSSNQSQEPTPLDSLQEAYEGSYKNPELPIDPSALPTVEELKDAIEDLCENHGITRICLLIDEAIHIFRPEQQRQFFTLFRDLRSPYISCNAAVYPGVTSYGDVFELTHDATLKRLDRDPGSSWYLDGMRDLAMRQVDSTVSTAILKNPAMFAILCYCVAGNPRLLLKNIAQCPNLRATEVAELIRNFYRSGIWAEHLSLAENYPGHRSLIDWGRTFIESEVLPRLNERNVRALKEEAGEASAYFWVHRDAPESVKHALRLLAYTGIVQKGEDGMKGTRGEPGTRYTVNFGCVLSLQSSPTTVGLDLIKRLSIKRFVEFGANHSAFSNVPTVNVTEEDALKTLLAQLARPVTDLDLTYWQKSQLTNSGITTIGEVLRTDESYFVANLYYVGPKRARRIKNAADSAVLEYLSG